MPGTTPNSSSTKRNLVSATPLLSSKRIRLNDNAELGLSIDIDDKPVLPRCNNVRSRSLIKQVESRGTTSTFKLPDLNATPKSPTTRQLYKDILQEKIISATEIDVSFDDFPYYLSDTTKNSLISSTFIRLKYSNVNSEVPDFNSIGPKMLLSGPAGSETYQEMLVKALAKHFGVRLLIVDSRLKTDAYIVGPLIFEEEDEVHKNRFLKYALDVSSEIACSESKNGPLIVYFKSADKDVLNAACRESKFKLSKCPRNAVVIASSIRTNQVENLFDAGKCKALEVMLTNMGVLIPNRGTGSQANPEPKDEINMLFKHEISIELPQDHTTLAILKRQLERDVGMVKAKVNINKIRSVLYKKHLNSSKDLETLCISDETLARESVDKIGGWALSHYLMNDREAEKEGVVISAENIKYGLNLLQSFRKGRKSLRNSLKDVVTENDFEKKLLADVIASDDMGVSFGDIGSLEKVKDTLTELVMLPLQRPELFSKGQLAKPSKGILLFGPPGTGKTMLAKAVATEVGANFINVSMSSLTSKWFGEAEKIVKAVFTLASKIAPTIIFIDEVDSMLGKRGSSGEHETMRKMKNEFMMNWDGLRTKDNERVVVLAATNRPFDLDEAVIRRFPRRLMVNLPDSKNREKILRVLLGKEEMASDVDLGLVAKITEGFSGSDLKNLCIVAAHCPLRELLEQEKKGRSLALAEKKALPALQGSADIRALNMEDFKFAHGQVCASCESSSTNELVEWNNLFGEGESRKKEQLSYYM